MIKAGQKLYFARVNKSLTLEDIAKATKIRPSFLAAIEKGEYDKLPSPAYAKGFVSNYASYLGLSQKETLALFRREYDEKKQIKVLPDSLTKSRSISLPRLHLQRSVFVLAFLLTSLSVYLGFQYRSMFMAPELTISSPADNSRTGDTVRVTGKTDPNSTVSINNETVVIKSSGEFSKNINLFPGKTTITITSKSRIGKETIEKRTITVK